MDLLEKKCPKCGTAALLEWEFVQFCSDCGTKLEVVGPCPTCECGKTITRHVEFCSYCGRPNKWLEKDDKQSWWNRFIKIFTGTET